MNLKPLIAGYAAKLNDTEYKALRAEVIRVVRLEDEKRGLK